MLGLKFASRSNFRIWRKIGMNVLHELSFNNISRAASKYCSNEFYSCSGCSKISLKTVWAAHSSFSLSKILNYYATLKFFLNAHIFWQASKIVRFSPCKEKLSSFILLKISANYERWQNRVTSKSSADFTLWSIAKECTSLRNILY